MREPIPSGWIEASFRDIAGPVRDKYLPRHFDGDLPCVNLENLPEGAGRIVGASKASDNLSIKTAFKSGDVLFGKLRPYLRKYAQADFDGVCTTEIMAFRPNEQVDPRFLFHVVGSAAFIDHNVAVSFGTKMPRTDWRTAGDFPVLLPPLDVQRRLAAILSALDEQIEKTEALIEKKRLVKVGLTQELLIAPCKKGKQKQIKLSTVAALKGGTGFPERYQGGKSGIPFIKVSDMNLPGNERYIQKANNYVGQDIASRIHANVFPAEATVFAKVGAALLLNRRRLLVQPAIIDNNMMAALPLGINANFLYQFLLTVDFGLLVQPGALPSVNQEQIGGILIPEYSELEQMRIVSVLEAADEELNIELNELVKLRLQKTGLMRDLLTGNVQVKEMTCR